jgi:hypothetical protein
MYVLSAVLLYRVCEKMIMKSLVFIDGFAVFQAQAQVTFFNDSLGLPLGTANQMGNTTFYNDAKGLPLGTAQNMGNVTFFNDALGLPLGTASTPQPILPLTSPQTILPPAPFFPTNPRGW